MSVSYTVPHVVTYNLIVMDDFPALLLSNKMMYAIECLSNGMIFTGIGTFILLQFVTAPFGKHAPNVNTWKFGPLWNARLCWLIMESPNVLHVWRRSDCFVSAHINLHRKLLLALFGVHYFNRAVVYSYRMSNSSKPMPLAIMMSALLFCCFNGYLQVESLCQKSYPPINQYQYFLGLTFFVVGFMINLDSDNILRKLKQQRNGYSIPVGGLFTYVSCPNFLGEIIEWIGFAIACGSKASFSFAFYTCCNLIPRAFAHHRWYVKSFKDYPTNRGALIPLSNERKNS